MSSYASRVRELLDARGWSVRQLATASGVNERTLQSYLQHDREIPTKVLAAIVQTSGASFAWLFLGEGDMFPAETPADALSGNLRATQDGPSPQKAARQGAHVHALRAVQPIYVPPTAADIYERALDVDDEQFSDFLRRAIRVYLGGDERTRVRVSGFLEGLDPGEKKAGLGGRDGRTGASRRAGTSAHDDE